MRRPNDIEPVVCAVCKRAAIGAGVGKIGQRVFWSCGDIRCTSLLTKVSRMPVRDLSTLEACSLADAGDAAGAYLQSLGKTDLGDLAPEQWLRFLAIILTSYESQMRARLTGKTATPQ